MWPNQNQTAVNQNDDLAFSEILGEFLTEVDAEYDAPEMGYSDPQMQSSLEEVFLQTVSIPDMFAGSNHFFSTEWHLN